MPAKTVCILGAILFAAIQGQGVLAGGIVEPCVPTCNGAMSENEPCGTDANNGCYGNGHFGEIYCGKPMCGELSVEKGGAVFDVDWFTLNLSGYPGRVQVLVTLASQVPANIYLTDTNCTAPAILAEGDGVCPRAITMCLDPGVYRVLVAPTVTDGYPCGSPNRRYRLEVQCSLHAAECCDQDAIATTPTGAPIMPPNWDLQPPQFIDVDQDRGKVADLYPGMDTSLDTWYGQIRCDPTIGDGVDRDDEQEDLAQELRDLGITDDPDVIASDLDIMEDMAAAQVAAEPNGLGAAPAVVPAPFAPGGPHCPPASMNFVFGGRDIVLIHGLRLEHLVDSYSGVPGANAHWIPPTVFPGNIQNPQFYGTGYFKQRAEANWSDYTANFLAGRNIKNRYLVVCYPCTERAEVAVQAVLTQIADAMRTGLGVVDPSGCNNTANFGTPSFVVLSHSTGALITDASMHAAATYPNLKAGFIAQQCKAHIAPSGAFLGSHLATAAVGIAAYIPYSVAWDACKVAEYGMKCLDPDMSFPPCGSSPSNLKDMAQALVGNSVLIDLIPKVAQSKWGPAIAGTPVRTISAVAGHPDKTKPAKYWLHRGFDDGVVTINSQVPNPNPVGNGASAFWPDKVRKVFDLGLKHTLYNPKRAKGYYRDQKKDKYLPDGAVAAGATRWVSPTGMLQPINQMVYAGWIPEARYPNHFTYLQSASSHKAAVRMLDRYPFYEHSDNGYERNWEETRVITDPAVYSPYPAGQGDVAPLLKTTCMKPLREEVRGRKILFSIKIFGKKFSREKWIWRRVYHVLESSWSWHQIDYIHQSVLCTPLDCPHPHCYASADLNSDGVVDAADLGILLGAWGSSTGAADLSGDGLVDGADLGVMLGAWTGSR